MNKYIISLTIEGHLFFLKNLNPSDRTISIEVDESEAKKFDTKAEAWDFVSLYYLKHKYGKVGVRMNKKTQSSPAERSVATEPK